LSEVSEAVMAASEGRWLAWGLAAVLLLANVAGCAFALYAASWRFDRILHAATLFAITFWFATIVLGVRSAKAMTSFTWCFFRASASPSAPSGRWPNGLSTPWPQAT
jgi:hypothetical protein